MSGAAGFLVGIVLLALSLSGLAYALHLFMTHADPDAGLKAAAGLGVFVVAALATLVVAR